MAKRRPYTKTSPPEVTVLVMSREAFRSNLKERIDKGEEIIRSASSHHDLSRMHRDFEEWHDYNKEFLKQSFNNP